MTIGKFRVRLYRVEFSAPRNTRIATPSNLSAATSRVIIGVYALAFIAGLNVDKVIARIEDLRRCFFY
jgi:hypothetical protein